MSNSLNDKGLTNSKVHHFGFLVLPGFSLIALAAAVDALRLANRFSNNEIYTWKTVAESDEHILASNQLSFKPDLTINCDQNYDYLFVCGGARVRNTYNASIGNWLKQKDKQGVPLGGLCTGTYILAKAELLDGYRFTIHWENIAATREEFPALNITDDVYEIDRNRYSCAGGTSPIDLMHHLISIHHGRELASEVSEGFLVEHIRNMTDRQRTPLRQRLGTSQPKLSEVVTLMEANLEDKLSIDDLSNLIGLSRRQIERLFRRYLNCTPSQYYQNLCLRNGRRLVLQTDTSIIEISILCGFGTQAHFSKCYKDKFNTSPRNDRREILELWSN